VTRGRETGGKITSSIGPEADNISGNEIPEQHTEGGDQPAAHVVDHTVAKGTVEESGNGAGRTIPEALSSSVTRRTREEEEKEDEARRRSYWQEMERRYDLLIAEIEKLNDRIVRELQSSPTAQRSSLDALSLAANELEERSEGPGLTLFDLLAVRRRLSLVDIELARASTRRFSTKVVAMLIYAVAVGTAILVWTGVLNVDEGSAALNEELFLGVPTPVWIWAAIGSFTSMLLRAGQSSFKDKSEAIRWMIYRPVVGLVMGVLIYLMLVAGLIVFAGSPDTQAPELIWVVAFVGSFSDTISVDLLQRLLGRFKDPAPADAAGGDPLSATMSSGATLEQSETKT
jgi:hypothetical protein